MSFILDALRKSERQRKLGSTPDIHIPIVDTGADKKPTGRLLFLLGVVLLMLCVWLWVLFSAGQPEESSQSIAGTPAANPEHSSQAAATTSASAGAAQPQPTPQLDTAPADNRSAAQTAGTANARPPAGQSGAADSISAARQSATPDDFTLPPTRSRAQSTDSNASSLGESLPSALQDQQPEQPQVLAEQGVAQQAQQSDAAETAEPLQSEAEAAAEPASEQPWQPGVPSLMSFFDLPVNVRRELPELNVSIRVYDDIPENRFVVINNERMSEGGSIGDVTISEIRRDSLVLDYREYRFEYK